MNHSSSLPHFHLTKDWLSTFKHDFNSNLNRNESQRNPKSSFHRSLSLFISLPLSNPTVSEDISTGISTYIPRWSRRWCRTRFKIIRRIPRVRFFSSLSLPFSSPLSWLCVRMRESNRKYRFMESTSLQRRAGLEEKCPELKRTIEMIKLLIRKKVYYFFLIFPF